MEPIYLLHGFVILSYIIVCWIAANPDWHYPVNNSGTNFVIFASFLLFGWLVCPIYSLHKIYLFVGKKIKLWWGKIDD